MPRRNRNADPQAKRGSKDVYKDGSGKANPYASEPRAPAGIDYEVSGKPFAKSKPAQVSMKHKGNPY